MNTPDRWIVLDLNSGKDQAQKVFAGWYGGYLSGDSWRLSSAIVTVEEFDNRFEFTNSSGSVYVCYKDAYGMSRYMSSILGAWQQKYEERSDITFAEAPKYAEACKDYR